MATQMTPGGHGTIRFIISAIVIGVLGYGAFILIERSSARAKDNCSIDLEAANREIKTLKSSLDVDTIRRTEETDRAVKAAVSGLVAERDACRKEVDRTDGNCKLQLDSLKDITNAQVEALRALPEKQAQVFEGQMKAWRDECANVVQQTRALANARNEECARAAETAVNVCRLEKKP